MSIGEAGLTPAEMQTPSLFRRLASFVYEGVLLFGLLMMAGFVYSALTQMRHAQQGRMGLQFFLFVVLGIYFVWFWSHGGQTVAMKAWHIRLVDTSGRPVAQPRALLRYLLSWLWFIPALTVLWLSGLSGGGAMFVVTLAGVVAYAGIAKWMPQTQFWHDVVCGTRLVTCQTRPTKPLVR